MRPTARLAFAAALLALTPIASLQAKENSHSNTTTYTTFDALTATIWRTNHTRGVLTVQGGLDIKDPALHARAAKSEPLLRDAYVRTLNVYAAALTPGAPPDVDQIGLRLQRATDQVLQKPGAKVLLGTVLVN